MVLGGRGARASPDGKSVFVLYDCSPGAEEEARRALRRRRGALAAAAAASTSVRSEESAMKSS